MEMTLDSSIDTAEEEIIRRYSVYLSLLVRDEHVAILIHACLKEGILSLKELNLIKISNRIQNWKRKEKERHTEGNRHPLRHLFVE